MHNPDISRTNIKRFAHHKHVFVAADPLDPMPAHYLKLGSHMRNHSPNIRNSSVKGFNCLVAANRLSILCLSDGTVSEFRLVTSLFLG